MKIFQNAIAILALIIICIGIIATHRNTVARDKERAEYHAALLFRAYCPVYVPYYHGNLDDLANIHLTYRPVKVKRPKQHFTPLVFPRNDFYFLRSMQEKLDNL